MKTFYVIWTYMANSSERPLYIEAHTKEEAAGEVRRIFSPDFAEKAVLFITEEKPYESRPEN